MFTGNWEITAEKTDWRGVTLYRARHAETGKEYLLEDLALAAPTKERIYRQIALGLEEPIRTAQEVEHPALLRPLALTRYGDKYFLVREMDPLLWEAWGPEPVPADPDEVGRWLLTAAEVTAAYHEKGLWTRGIARVDLVRTAEGVRVLEPLCQSYLAAYRDRTVFVRYEVAPEIAQGKEWDRAADMFALGLTAYFLATGRLPFPGEGADFMAALLAGQPVDPRVYNLRLGPEFVRVILGLLSRGPEDRPSAPELATTLARLAAEGKFTATPAEQEEFARRGRQLAGLVEKKERLRLFLRHYRGALLVGLAVVLFFVSFFVFRERTRPTITATTSPAQVVAAYYRAMEKLDVTLLEETLAPGVGRGTVNMVVHLFVVHRTRVAYEGKPLDSPGPLKIENLKITQTKDRPPEFIARYDLLLERGDGEGMVQEVQACEDHLRLARRKDRRVGEKWVIVSLRQKVLAKREIRSEAGSSPPQ